MSVKRKKKPRKSGKSIYDVLGDKIQEHVQERKKSEKIDIGKTIREIRFEKKLSGADLCRRSKELDPRTLTALEKGRIKNPSVRTLQAVAQGLDITVGELFRHAELGFDRYFFYQGSQKGAYNIQFPTAGVKAVSFTPFIEDFFCGKLIIGARKHVESTFFEHPCPIYISTLVGKLEVKIESRKVVLKEGENLFFHGILEHSFYNPLQRESVLMLITTPSLFKGKKTKESSL